MRLTFTVALAVGAPDSKVAVVAINVNNIENP
jgi:hypothetical protein